MDRRDRGEKQVNEILYYFNPENKKYNPCQAARMVQVIVAYIDGRKQEAK